MTATFAQRLFSQTRRKNPFCLPEGEIQGLAGWLIALERSACRLSRHETRIEGFTIPYLKGGQGEPLVLVHGFGGSKDNFNRFAAKLTQHFTVYAIDVPGFGGSTRNLQAEYDIPTQTRRLHQIIQSLGLSKPHLAGNSMGGWISGLYAATYPDETGSVLFLAPAGMKASWKSEVLRLYTETGEILLTPSNLAEYERFIDLVMYKRPAFAPKLVIKAMAARAAKDLELNQRIYKTFKSGESDLASQLQASGFKRPAMIVWGENDRVLDVAGADELKQALPEAELMRLKKTGHAPMMEKPAEVAQAYVAWRKALR
ncbi:alpha/beta hydrolase [Limnobacter sp.]|uniref:alpha/beta fold hydrolase n=1 Tax=Limnobacter sp. TaxID=2003368 RepID=UPI002586D286|nr:alpha/beta hydrolase [Limnobacter sp.]